MTRFTQIIITACLFIGSPCIVFSQNTLDGQAKIVPEAEVNRQSLFIEAERERLLGHHEKAVERYKQFLYDNSENAAAWYGLARTFEAQNDPVNALDAAAKAVQKDPENDWYAVFRADLMEKVGQAGDAAKIYQDLVKRNPQNTAFHERLAYLLVLSGDPRGGLKALDQLEKLTGVTEVTADKKHVIYLGLGELKKAATELEKLADAFPKRLEYRHRVALFWESVGDKNAARKVYEEILRRDPNDNSAQIAVLEKSGSDLSYLNALKPFFKDPLIGIDGKIREILPYFEKLAKGMAPEAVEALLDLGRLVEQAHADDPKAWSLSGDLFYHAHRPLEAFSRYQTCIQLKPAVFSVWENSMAILYEQKDFKQLLDLAEKAMDDFPNQASAFYYYGVAAVAQGKFDDAISQLEQAGLMAGSNLMLKLDVSDQIGLALLGKKDFPAARTQYENSLSQGGEQHPGILEHYGDVLFLLGDRGKAAEYWQRAQKLAPTPELAQKIATGKL